MTNRREPIKIGDIVIVMDDKRWIGYIEQYDRVYNSDMFRVVFFNSFFTPAWFKRDTMEKVS